MEMFEIMDNAEYTKVPTEDSNEWRWKNVNHEDSPESTENVSDIIVEKVTLERKVGLMSAIAMIVGTIIGSGIFVTPKGVLRHSGSTALSLIIWFISGILSMFGALCFAELGASISKSGSEYIYMLEAFRPLHPVLGPIPAFSFFWMSFWIMKPTTIAIVALSFAEYLCKPIWPCTNNLPEIPVKLFAGCCIAFITFINCISVKAATKVQLICTAAKLLGLFIIACGGFVMLIKGNTSILATGFENSQTSITAISEAFFSGLWAFDGWNSLNYISEEIVNPERNFPLAIYIAMPIVILSYLCANVAYLTVLTPNEILQSEAVAVSFGDKVLGVMSWIIPLSVILSTIGATNGACFANARLSLVAAREEHMMGLFSFVHTKKRTPVISLIFNSIMAFILILLADIFTLINLFEFTTWLFYGISIIALLLMRVTKKDLHRPLKINLIIPIIVLALSVYLVIAPIYNHPKVEYIFALLFILSGLILYIPLIYYRIRFQFLNKITVFFQMIFNVIPSEYS